MFNGALNREMSSDISETTLGEVPESKIDLKQALSVANRAADTARDIIVRGYQNVRQVHVKDDDSLVTDTDRQSELAICEMVRAAYPDHHIVGEEFGTRSGDSEYRWFVDPLDGTVSFVHGIPTASCLIALCRGTQPLVAVLDVPALGQRLSAVRGQGAWDGNKRLTVGEGFDPMYSVICHGDRYTFELGGHEAVYDRAAENSRFFRSYTDAFGHTLVAKGSAALVMDSAMEPWDLAAPALILHEAGAAITLYPDRNDQGRRFMIAGTRAAVDWAMQFVPDLDPISEGPPEIP